jgi:dsRNA-specific ribonuclease
MKKTISTLSFEKFFNPNFSFQQMKSIRKKIEKREKEIVLNLQAFQKIHGLEEIGDLKTFQSIFVHPSSTKDKNEFYENVDQVFHFEFNFKRLSLLGESILDTFITSYLIQRFDFVEIKWKQGIMVKFELNLIFF